MVKISFKKLIKQNIPRWMVLMIDCYIVINTFILAYFIRFNFELTFDVSKLKFQLPLVLLVALVSFISIGSYKGAIRHTSFKDAVNISLASILILIFLSMFVFLNRNYGILVNFTIPISILTIHFLLNMLALIVLRHIFKEFYKLLTEEVKVNKRVLIYGAGEAGILTYLVLKQDKESGVDIEGFVDDDKRKANIKIHGLKVFDSNNINKLFIKNNKIEEIILSIQKIKPVRLLEITNELSKLGVKIKIVPPASTWINGDLNIKQIKNLKIEDLLGRASIEICNSILKNEFSSKVVLITGAAGSIGSEIAKQISNFKYKHLVLVDQAESDLYNLQQYFINKNTERITVLVADVRNSNRMETIFKQYQPQLIFHAAAYKHVPLMEKSPYEAVNVNVSGTKNIADLAIKHKVEKFVMISTDKAVNPTNVMGATKRIAEMYINTLNLQGITKFMTTRFGNVLGSNGSVIHLFKAQIEQGGPLTVTHKEITRYFMTIPEACSLVLEAATIGTGGEIFVFDMGESIKIYDLALNMIHLSGFKFPDDIDIKIIGLRPGEKIYEELLANGEHIGKTHHEKIMIANIIPLDRAIIKQNIEELCKINFELNYTATVKKMKEIVPEFISNNSIYEGLDIEKLKNE
ncbi:nucleoside-diphosphate sugar epimerase/dehydratase [Lutibacter sp.]|uniref:polysaccharide biosynthesis protein n=1 Tax=Lutibacter sp. TaxID=1925666 RepID=UPI002735F711|nr:nucleoside-diphosphate sugar epimerase/dehydratase [Lutibacter sp.]MDP3313051.1 nucleoside-diphosphate sugar epimerase/dehydratase [Lutibacter sp.]